MSTSQIFHRSYTYPFSIDQSFQALEELVNKSDTEQIEPIAQLVRTFFEGMQEQEVALTSLNSAAQENQKPLFNKTLKTLTLALPCSTLGAKIVAFINQLDHSDYKNPATRISVLALGHFLKSPDFARNEDIYDLSVRLISTVNENKNNGLTVSSLLLSITDRFTEGSIGYLASRIPVVSSLLGYDHPGDIAPISDTEASEDLLDS